jgi:hypothetical protein
VPVPPTPTMRGGFEPLAVTDPDETLALARVDQDAEEYLGIGFATDQIWAALLSIAVALLDTARSKCSGASSTASRWP